MKNHLKIVIVFLLICSDLLGQGLSEKQIDSAVARSMKSMPQAGLAIAVVKNGETIFSKGYGTTSVNQGNLVNAHTLFAIASNTKSFTSAALAILVDEGKITWQDKVSDYIPEFKMYDPYVTANFNIQDLLTHRSGMDLGAGDLMFFPDGADFSMKDVLNSFQYQKAVSAFRTKYDYDNLLYMVAGEVVARVSGKPWIEFLQERILDPLGMTRSAPQFSQVQDLSNVAMPHSVVKGKIHQISPYSKPDSSLASAGAIYSSVSDMSRWLQLQLNRGKFNQGNDSLFSAEAHQEMWKPHTIIHYEIDPEPPYRTRLEAYGLGWFVSEQNSYAVISHTGGLPGMLSKTVMVPELDLGVVVLTNTDPGGYSYSTLANTLIDSYIGVANQDWIGQAEKMIRSSAMESDAVSEAVWETVSKAPSDAIDPEDYIGTYEDPWFGKVTISLEQEQLWFRSLRSPKLNGPMHFYKANSFAIPWEYQDMPCDALASFILDAEGKASGLTLKGISPTIDFSFDFQHLNLKRVDSTALSK